MKYDHDWKPLSLGLGSIFLKLLDILIRVPVLELSPFHFFGGLMAKINKHQPNHRQTAHPGSSLGACLGGSLNHMVVSSRPKHVVIVDHPQRGNNKPMGLSKNGVY
jgi:hypothetical protein